ncbi:MAG: hypothetical protein MJ087_05290 [Lachnospiraceae bacterium]|nr:hypothetical protein [Lachnospiraceae bacterium]
MREFVAEYGSVVVTVIIVLAICGFASTSFAPQLQNALTNIMSVFLSKSGVAG